MRTDESWQVDGKGKPPQWLGPGATVLACALTTALSTLLLGHLDLANIVMLFLLTVLLIAVRFGRNEAILASVLSVLLFDVFFVPPRFSLAVSDLQYLVTFVVMLATGLMTTHLTAGLKRRAREASLRERQTRALYGLAHRLAGALTLVQVAELVLEFGRQELSVDAHVLLPDTNHGLKLALPDPTARFELHFAQAAMDGGRSVRHGDLGQLGYASLYLPLPGATRMRGALAVRWDASGDGGAEEDFALLEALASLAAVAVERVHYADVAQSTEVKMMAERLRSSILSALSHDLRTPLTAMVGLADSLCLVKPSLSGASLETAQALREQAERLSGMVANILDMARLNAGEVRLRREWQPIEEVVGASIKLLGSALAGHQIRVRLDAGLPLLEFDAVLIERVLCNLLDNAAKYAPVGTTIELSAELCADSVAVRVSDQGPGFPGERHDALFDMFVRGEAGLGKPGSGLGLAICKAIVEAHGGTITASNAPEGGGVVGFTLPLGTPPVLEEERP